MATEKHLILDDISHAIKKSYMTGHFKRVQQKSLALNDKNELYKCELDHSPALLKIIDEVLCNCCDTFLKTKTVTEIRVNIEEDGCVIIYNNGNGIPVYEHEEGTKLRGRKCYWPECCFSMFRAGSNLEVDDTHSVAGVNGLGAKLTGIHSDWLELITVDNERKLMYSQVFKDCLRDPSFPVVERYTKKPFTQVSFLPKYTERFFYDIEKNPKELKEVIDIIRYRIIHMATFLGYFEKGKVKMYYQDEEIKIKDTKSLLNIFTETKGYDVFNITSMASGDIPYFLSYSVCVKQGTLKTTSVINGIMVKDGSHITYLKRKINSKIKELQTAKDTKKIDCSANIIIVAAAWLCVDNWGTQTKDSLGIPESDFKRFEPDEHIITSIAKKIISITKSVEQKKEAIPKKISKTIVYDKYTPPKKKSHNNALMLVEGDSASTLIRSGLNHGCSGYTFDNTGIFSLGGVPINVAKTTLKTKEDETEADADDDDDDLGVIEKANQKFWDSKIFGALVQALNLDPNKTYTVQADMKTLNYSKVIIAVDQDLDGRGNICSLVLQMFFRYWPFLFNHNFIQYWNSPIIRIIKKSTSKVVEEFKYESDFEKWKKQRGDKDTHDLNIMYIKGLATHDNKYVKDMFSHFDKDVLVLSTNRDTRKMFDLYFGYGKEYSDQRKVVLQTPVKHFTDAEVRKIEETRAITCNRHLDLNTKEFQIAAGKRTLCGLDGMTPVRRKIFTVMLNHNITQPMKLFQIGARAAYELSYHHGDKSINDAVLKMAQNFLGSNHYPLLKGDGQMGTRNKKGTDAGSARYIAASLNKQIVDSLFHKDDIHILPKQYDDGVQIEPHYYIPALPLCILENNKAVAPGWSLYNIGRDLDSVVKLLIKLSEDKKITDKEKELPPNKKGYKGVMELGYKDKQSVVEMHGKWRKLSADSIVIEELPLTLTPHKYYLELVKDEEKIHTVRNYTDNEVRIEIDFKHGVLDKIESMDTYLGLKGTVCEQFNFINENGVLEHFDTAYDVLYRCFTLNKQKYRLKIDRELLLLKYMILRETNIIKFMEKDEITHIYKKKEDQINEILKTKKYDTINNTAINTHAKYTTDELKKELETIDIKTGYNYLRQVSFGEVSDENIVKRVKKLKEMEDRCRELEEMLKEKPFPGAKEYIKDIKKAYECLR